MTIVASLVILGLSSGAAIQAQGAESVPAGQATQAEVSSRAPPPSPDNPFALTLIADRDAWIDESDPDTNHGSDLTLQVGQAAGAADEAHILVDFDLSTLPQDAVIVSASLGMHAAEGQPTDAIPVVPWAIWSGWVESYVKWSNRPLSSDEGSPSDCIPGAWTFFDVGNIVSGWLDNTIAEQGIMLKPGASANGRCTFDASDSAYPPELTIVYTRIAELTSVADTWVDGSHPSTNYGSHPWIYAEDGDSQWALVQFDLSGLPPEFHVIDAQLSLFAEPNLAAQGANAPLYTDVKADAITAT